MKAGKEHRVPLSARAVEILEAVKPLKQDSLFPADKGGKLSTMAMSMLLRRMKLDCTVHGFRSGFRDWAAECTGYAHEVCEMALAHVIGNKSEAAYRRGDLSTTAAAHGRLGDLLRKRRRGWSQGYANPGRGGMSFADDAELSAFIGRDHLFPAITPEAVANALEGFALSLIPGQGYGLAGDGSAALTRHHHAKHKRRPGTDFKLRYSRRAGAAGSLGRINLAGAIPVPSCCRFAPMGPCLAPLERRRRDRCWRRHSNGRAIRLSPLQGCRCGTGLAGEFHAGSGKDNRKPARPVATIRGKAAES